MKEFVNQTGVAWAIYVALFVYVMYGLISVLWAIGKRVYKGAKEQDHEMGSLAEILAKRENQKQFHGSRKYIFFMDGVCGGCSCDIDEKYTHCDQCVLSHWNKFLDQYK